jgi:hypothetical protein
MAELPFDEVEMQLDLRLDERASGLARDRLGDRPHEERHGRRLYPVEDELDQEGRHERALGVVQPVRVPKAIR